MISKFYRTPMLYLIAGAIGLCSLSACNFSGADTLYIRPIDILIPADESSVQALVGLTFDTIADGDTATVTFSSPTTFELTSGENTLDGTVTYGPGASCTVTVENSTFPAGEGPQVGDEVQYDPCTINIQTEESSQSGVSQPGTVTLMLGNLTSDPEPVTVRVEDAGNGMVNIFVNGELIAIGEITAWGDIRNATTPAGATGATGTGGTGGTGGIGGGS